MQLTKDATRIGPQDHERLRSEGFDDQAILQITLIASWCNYINRVADALGVGREPAYRTTAHLTFHNRTIFAEPRIDAF